ncbi:MAG: DUF4162 domain-containing protein, partial [Actinobacteria bacterium]|nr:DUF4162 domain-containing protein [Actinomycetota bacterium]
DRLAHRLAIASRGKVVVEGSPEGLKRGLRGDSVTVELTDANGRDRDAESAVRSLLGVHDAALDGRMLRARVEHGGTAVPGIVSALEARGISVAAVTVARPSLDDVYLHVTGRDFKTEDEEGA